MDIIRVIIQIVDCVSPSIAQRWKDHRDVYKNLNTLKKRSQELNFRKKDNESKLSKELEEVGTEAKAEVKSWLDSVEKIVHEVDEIEEKVRNAKFFSRAGLGKLVNLKIAEVEEIYGKGVFDNGLVIQLPRRGYEKPMKLTLGGGATFEKTMDEMWACLSGDEVSKVGVYGMGGIGKTTALKHTQNRILKDCGDYFDTVIWVTASQGSSVKSLQGKIAHKLGLDLSNDDDIERRAERLYEALRRKTRFALFLDDLWETYSLEEVGIPEPSSENGCKLVVATRTYEICRDMSSKSIKMEVLSEEESLDLFLDVVGRSALSSPKLAAIVKEVVRECSRLPLAIVVVAASLKGIADINEWETALEDLREYSAADSASSKILGQLQYSYDRLGDKGLQDCFLYCALYPEDDIIERKSLIEHLMAEGIIEEKKTRQARIRKGQVMLNKLVSACLLNDDHPFRNQISVKMHDLVRDMALKTTSRSPRYMVKARAGLESALGKENWDEDADLVKVSLIGNANLSSIPSEIEPKNCVRLSTLLLQRNYNLSSISKEFFLHMKSLNVLDVSDTAIQNLPESISDLTALTALFLSDCRKLSHVPSLAKLVKLRLLDLNGSPIKEVPRGLEMLTRLRYLGLNSLALETIPAGILCNLVDLQYLSIVSYTSKVISDGIERLRKLETVEGKMYKLDNWNALVKSLESRQLVSYALVLGDCKWRSLTLEDSKKVVLLILSNAPKISTEGDCPLLFIKGVEFLTIMDWELKVGSLCELESFRSLTSLRSFSLEFSFKDSNFDGYVFSFSHSSAISPLLRSLERLRLYHLPEFRGLFRKERGASAKLPLDAFSSLKHFHISYCPEIKSLFMIAFLPNLEELEVKCCDKLMEISTEVDISLNHDEDQCFEISRAINMIRLPKLNKLVLKVLPNLQSLPLIADSVKTVDIKGCRKLKRIHILDREPYPSSFEHVRIDNETWSSLEWEYPDAKCSIQSINNAEP